MVWCAEEEPIFVGLDDDDMNDEIDCLWLLGFVHLVI
jgi:hypothetical protein